MKRNNSSSMTPLKSWWIKFKSIKPQHKHTRKLCLSQTQYWMKQSLRDHAYSCQDLIRKWRLWVPRLWAECEESLLCDYNSIEINERSVSVVNYLMTLHCCHYHRINSKALKHFSCCGCCAIICLAEKCFMSLACVLIISHWEQQNGCQIANLRSGNGNPYKDGQNVDGSICRENNYQLEKWD